MPSAPSLVKEFLKTHPVCSYDEIARGCGIQKSMVSGCIRILVGNKEIIRHTQHNAQGRQISNQYEVLEDV